MKDQNQQLRQNLFAQASKNLSKALISASLSPFWTERRLLRVVHHIATTRLRQCPTELPAL